MSGEANEVIALLRHLDHLQLGEAVSLCDWFEAAALADAWNEQHPNQAALICQIRRDRWVVSVP